MPKTPDRRPGGPLREEEGAFFDEQAAPADTPGQLVYYSGRWSFYDSSGEYDPRSGGGISEAQHKALRQLIHLADGGGPFEGFTSGAYRETLPAADPFPTSIIWWESSLKLKKIVEKTITWSANKTPGTIAWKAYDTGGSLLVTVTDTISYSGVFETSRTRTIA